MTTTPSLDASDGVGRGDHGLAANDREGQAPPIDRASKVTFAEMENLPAFARGEKAQCGIAAGFGMVHLKILC
jgi:hypothetical protein